MTETRVCLRCGRTKGIKEFRRDLSRPLRRCVARCRDCEARQRLRLKRLDMVMGRES